MGYCSMIMVTDGGGILQRNVRWQSAFAMMEAMENCLVAISVSLFCSNIVDVVEEAL